MNATDLTWQQGMSRAYARGLADGKLRAPEVLNGNGFDACYFQGFGHGSGECRCPERLAGKRWGQRCIVCGHHRHTGGGR